MPHNCPLKCLESIKLHLPEDPKRDLQDLAMQDNRPVSETIRAVLETHVCGHVAKLLSPTQQDQARSGAARRP